MLQVTDRTVALLAEDLKRLHEHASLCEANLSVILRAEGVTSRASHRGTDGRTAGCNYRVKISFLLVKGSAPWPLCTPVKTQPNPPRRPWIRPADGLEDAREISQPAHEQQEPLECATPWQLYQRGAVSCQTHCPNRCAPGQSSSQLQGLQHVPLYPFEMIWRGGQRIHQVLNDLVQVCVGPSAVSAEIQHFGPTVTLNCEAGTRSCDVLKMLRHIL